MNKKHASQKGVTMLEIDENKKAILEESLLSYYDALKKGNMQKLSTLMCQESYISTLESLSFKHIFKDAKFKEVIAKAQSDSVCLQKVEETISEDLKQRVYTPIIDEITFEPMGYDRITLHYKENGHAKKQYYSLQNELWKIDYKAGRKRD